MNTTKLEDSKEKIKVMKKYQQEYLQDNEDAFASIVNTLSVEKIDNMTDEEILDFNKYGEGLYYIEEPEFENKEDLVEYVRSVIRFLVQTYEFNKEMDEKVEELNQLTEETNKMISEALGLDQSVSSIEVIERAIEKGLDKALELNDKNTNVRASIGYDYISEMMYIDKEDYDNANIIDVRLELDKYNNVSMHINGNPTTKHIPKGLNLDSEVTKMSLWPVAIE